MMDKCSDLFQLYCICVHSYIIHVSLSYYYTYTFFNGDVIYNIVFDLFEIKSKSLKTNLINFELIENQIVTN